MRDLLKQSIEAYLSGKFQTSASLLGQFADLHPENWSDLLLKSKPPPGMVAKLIVVEEIVVPCIPPQYGHPTIRYVARIAARPEGQA